MFLKKIKLQNIRSYTNGEIDFKEGTVLLSGDIGSGKSTILLGIEFALFGILRGDLSGTTLLRHGKTEGFVELHFDIDQKEAIIRRYLKKSSTGVKQDSGFIIINGIKTDGTAVELKTRILGLMGYPDELLSKSKAMIYRYTVYTPQELMKQILFDEKEERLNTLRRVFGIDKYKRIVENTSILTHHIKLDKKEIIGKIEDLERKKTELAQKEHRISELRKAEEGLDLEIEKIKAELSEKKKSFLTIESEKALLEKLKNERTLFTNEEIKLKKEKERLEGEASVLKKEIAELNESAEGILIEHIAHKEIDVEKDLLLLRQKKEEFSNKKNEIIQKTNYISEQIKSKTESITKKEAITKDYPEKKKQFESFAEKIKLKPDLEKKSISIQKELEELAGKMNGYDLRKKEMTENAKNISALDKCPLCQQQVSKDHKHDIKLKSDENLNHAEAELKLLHPQKEHKSEELNGLRIKLKEIIDAEQKYLLLGSELKNMDAMNEELVEEKELIKKLSEKQTELKKDLFVFSESKLAELEQGIKKFESTLKKIRDQNVLAEKKKGILAIAQEKQKTLDSNHERINIISKELNAIKSELANREFEIEKRKNIEADYLHKKKEVDDLQLKEVDFGKRQSSFQTEIKMTLQIKQDIQSEIKHKESERKRLEKITATQTFLETEFINMILSMEKHIMVNIHREFTELFRKWFSLLVEDDLLEARLDEDFSPIIMQNGYENDVSNLSGGEKTAIALAYRLALNKVINDLISTIKTKDIIILDEPTDGFSEEQLDKVRDVLDELKMRQIILVSHESKIEGFCDSVIRIVKRGHESAVL